jgi:hypothetical protein
MSGMDVKALELLFRRRDAIVGIEALEKYYAERGTQIKRKNH